MNLTLFAKRGGMVEEFELLQTPTKITYRCLGDNVNNTYEEYRKWVLETYLPYEELVYDDDDIFEEGEPIGTNTVNFSEEHLKELDEWLSAHKGCEIVWGCA